MLNENTHKYLNTKAKITIENPGIYKFVMYPKSPPHYDTYSILQNLLNLYLRLLQEVNTGQNKSTNCNIFCIRLKTPSSLSNVDVKIKTLPYNETKVKILPARCLEF